jgi:hypothetical protein
MGARARCEICGIRKWQIIAAGRELCHRCNKKRMEDRQHYKRTRQRKRESIKVELPW